MVSGMLKVCYGSHLWGTGEARGDNPLKDSEGQEGEHSGVGAGVFVSRVACDRISISARIHRHWGPCASNRLEQTMGNVGLVQSCSRLGVQTEPGFWWSQFMAIKKLSLLLRARGFSSLVLHNLSENGWPKSIHDAFLYWGWGAEAYWFEES